MAYFLAVDAGGTKTDLVLADETRVLARHRTGTVKLMRTSVETAANNLAAGLTALVHKSGVPLSAVQRTCIGTAGESVPLVANFLRSAFQERVAGKLLLVGDVEIALDAAFRGGAGVLVLAGTGSNVAGRTPSGVLASCGGWGPLLADQGSGHAIGLRALRSVFQAIDEGTDTLLQAAILNFWGILSVDLLVQFANQRPSPDLSQLTGVVVDCAALGDVVAQSVLRTEGRELAVTVLLLIRRLRALQGDADFSPGLAFAGSVMEHIYPVRAALVAHVREKHPALEVLPHVVDPVEGALWRARDEAAFFARLGEGTR